MRHCRGGLLAIVSLLALSGTVAFNHCALGGMKVSISESPGHSCCHSNGEKESLPVTSLDCCQKLTAPIPGILSAQQGHLIVLKPAWIENLAFGIPPVADRAIRVTAPAAGPPGRINIFVEVVLSRSLPACAPPLFVA